MNYGTFFFLFRYFIFIPTDLYGSLIGEVVSTFKKGIIIRQIQYRLVFRYCKVIEGYACGKTCLHSNLKV